MDNHVGRHTGTVIAVQSRDSAEQFWCDTLGFVPAADGSLVQPETQQTITLVELKRANPAMSAALQCDDVDRSLSELEKNGFSEYWREDTTDGKRFVMCRDEIGVFVLLYQNPTGTSPTTG